MQIPYDSLCTDDGVLADKFRRRSTRRNGSMGKPAPRLNPPRAATPGTMQWDERCRGRPRSSEISTPHFEEQYNHADGNRSR
jgi:hypothetical protein